MNSLVKNVPILMEDNYQQWEFAAKVFLMQIKAQYKKQLEIAFTTIVLLIDPKLQIHVCNTTTGKEAWEALKQIFKLSSRSRICHVHKQYYMAVMAKDEDMSTYLYQIMTYADELREMGAITSVLNTLDVEFNPQQMKSHLLEEAEQQKQQNSPNNSLATLGEAMQAQSKKPN
ncbi:hypothetical protein CHUAL_013495 [Chamberlinius hualienensis]